MAGISISMLAGDNSILSKSTDTKIATEKAEAKEQARIDIMAWITDRTANHENASLDDSKVKTILTGKSYVKEAKDKSFITAKGEYEIPYSELYQSSNGTPSNPITPTDNIATLKTSLENSNQDNVQINEQGVISNLVWYYVPLNDDECKISGYWDDEDCEHYGYSGNFSNGELENGFPIFIKSNNKVYRVSGIGQFAFWYITALGKIEVPEGIKTIDSNAFYRCENLTSITLPSSLTNVGNEAFRACSSLSNINFQNNVTDISNRCFILCTSLTSITINKPTDSISGAPWGAPNMTANDVHWAD